jgi:hypothetical protein
MDTVAVWFPLFVWLEFTTTVLKLPVVITFSELPIAEAVPFALF